MVASISAFYGGNLLSHKLCQKFASCSMYADFHSSNSTTDIARRNWCFKSYATEISKESPRFDEDADAMTTDFNDMCYKLPKSVSQLLASEEENLKRLLPIKPLQKKRVHHHNSFGVILEWKGVIVEHNELEPFVWYRLSLEEEKTCPSEDILKKIEGIKTEQALSEILHWSDNPDEVQRMATRKDFIYKELCGKHYQVRLGTYEFINAVMRYDVPLALVSNLSPSCLNGAVDSIGMKHCFDAIVSVEDVERGKPEPDLYELAADKIGIRPERCVVFGNTDLMTEAAHCAGMSCVAVASQYKVFELLAADHVVRWLDEVSYRELQALADGKSIGAQARTQANYMEIVIEDFLCQMRGGALEVLLVRAEGLKHSHFFGSSGHYAILQCCNQIIKSKITSEVDEKVWWNQKFRFLLPPMEFKEIPKLVVRIVRKVRFCKDCSIGETIIHLGEILTEGCENGYIEIKPAAYNIVLEDGNYKGEMKLGIRFIPNVELKQTYNSTRNIREEKQSICSLMLSIAMKKIPWSKIFFSQKCSAHEENRKNK